MRARKRCMNRVSCTCRGSTKKSVRDKFQHTEHPSYAREQIPPTQSPEDIHPCMSKYRARAARNKNRSTQWRSLEVSHCNNIMVEQKNETLSMPHRGEPRDCMAIRAIFLARSSAPAASPSPGCRLPHLLWHSSSSTNCNVVPHMSWPPSCSSASPPLSSSPTCSATNAGCWARSHNTGGFLKTMSSCNVRLRS